MNVFCGWAGILNVRYCPISLSVEKKRTYQAPLPEKKRPTGTTRKQPQRQAKGKPIQAMRNSSVNGALFKGEYTHRFPHYRRLTHSIVLHQGKTVHYRPLAGPSPFDPLPLELDPETKLEEAEVLKILTEWDVEDEFVEALDTLPISEVSPRD